MSGKMKVNLYGIFRVQNGASPNVGGPVQPNTSNMPKASFDITPETNITIFVMTIW